MFEVNSLAPGRFQFNFRKVIFKLTLVNGGWGISCQIALRWMPEDLPDDKSTLVQVMAWCRQATSHYLSQCWPRSVSPNGVTWPQWVKWCCQHYRMGHGLHHTLKMGMMMMMTTMTMMTRWWRWQWMMMTPMTLTMAMPLWQYGIRDLGQHWSR